jgi:hypothetical protein
LIDGESSVHDSQVSDYYSRLIMVIIIIIVINQCYHHHHRHHHHYKRSSTGVFVVKELILLDCIHTYYYNKRSLLSDEEYNELKDSLSWEGSVAVTLTAKEAHFISAVSAFRR